MALAATRLIPMRKNKGKSIGACLHNHTSYIQNPDKTEQGELVSSYQCSPLTVDEEFLLTKRLYEQTTGRSQKSDVIAYQVRQSFKPGEVTPEEANRIGYEFAERFLKGKHAFIVATHTDRAHMKQLSCRRSSASSRQVSAWACLNITSAAFAGKFRAWHFSRALNGISTLERWLTTSTVERQLLDLSRMRT